MKVYGELERWAWPSPKMCKIQSCVWTQKSEKCNHCILHCDKTVSPIFIKAGIQLKEGPKSLIVAFKCRLLLLPWVQNHRLERHFFRNCQHHNSLPEGREGILSLCGVLWKLRKLLIPTKWLLIAVPRNVQKSNFVSATNLQNVPKLTCAWGFRPTQATSWQIRSHLCLLALKHLASPFCYEDTMVYTLTMLSTQRLFDDVMKN